MIGYITKKIQINDAPAIRLSVVDTDHPEVEIVGMFFPVTPEMSEWTEDQAKAFFEPEAKRLFTQWDITNTQQYQDLDAAADNVISVIGAGPTTIAM